MQTKDLGGHSGCRIILCGLNETVNYVRKISSDVNYNKRLESQCKKQQEYKNDNILVPQILEQGYTSDGLFYFDMEYVRGITLAQHIKTVCVSDIKSIVEDITRSIACQNVHPEENVHRIFLEKIEDVEKNTHQKYCNSITTKCFHALKNHYWGKIPHGHCHGDLTLENIIVSGDRLYYIDFLDSFYDSWILDAGKILQDVQAMWSYRNEPVVDSNTAIRLHIFRDILLNKLANIATDDIIEEINYALLLHLARIYPYTSDKKTLSFIDSKVQSTLLTIGALRKGNQER